MIEMMSIIAWKNLIILTIFPSFSIEIYRFLCKKTGTDRKVIIIDNINNQFVAENKPAKRVFGISDAELIELFHENHN
jgi:hypothetical protein